jgi:general secretion pathway protein L
MRAAVVSGPLGGGKTLKEEEQALPEDPEERISTIREALLAWKQSYAVKGLVMGLGFEYFSHHFIDLPVSTSADIARALEFELERYLPLPPEEYLYDFHTLSAEKAGSRILVLAARKDRLHWIHESLEGTGLRLFAVRCSDVVALNRFIASGASEGAVFLSGVGGSLFAAGVRGGTPADIKAVRAGQDPARTLEQMRKDFSEGIYAAGMPQEVKQPGFDISAMSLPLAQLLARSAKSSHPLDMNFAAAEFQPRKTDYAFYVSVVLAAVTVLLFFSTTLLAYYKDYSILKRVQREIAEIKTAASGLLDMRRELEEIDRKRQFLYAFRLKKNSHIQILSELSKILPRDAWLTGFSSDEKGTVKIDGFARRTADIIPPLENSPLFRKVEFSSPVSVREGQERFSITMEIEG